MKMTWVKNFLQVIKQNVMKELKEHNHDSVYVKKDDIEEIPLTAETGVNLQTPYTRLIRNGNLMILHIMSNQTEEIAKFGRMISFPAKYAPANTLYVGSLIWNGDLNKYVESSYKICSSGEIIADQKLEAGQDTTINISWVIGY